MGLADEKRAKRPKLDRQPGELITLDGQGGELDIVFFYACGLPEAEIKQHLKNKRVALPMLKYIQFFGRETMIKIGVPFREMPPTL